LRNCKFEGKNVLGEKTYISGSSLGYGTYIGNNCELSNCIVGRFCSIGSNVRVVSATHPIDSNVSTHPAFYSEKYFFSYIHQKGIIEHLTTDKGYDCEIGNDVWIGDNVLIKGGTTIGDGAIVGMGSILTQDVQPYTVVVGIPAKPIRKRFNDKLINVLLQIKWWEKPIIWIDRHAEEFSNPQEFANTYFKINRE